MQQPLYASRREAATVLRVSLRTVDNLVGAKELVPVRVGRRVLIPFNQLDAFRRRSIVSTVSEEVE